MPNYQDTLDDLSDDAWEAAFAATYGRDVMAIKMLQLAALVANDDEIRALCNRTVSEICDGDYAGIHDQIASEYESLGVDAPENVVTDIVDAHFRASDPGLSRDIQGVLYRGLNSFVKARMARAEIDQEAAR